MTRKALLVTVAMAALGLAGRTFAESCTARAFPFPAPGQCGIWCGPGAQTVRTNATGVGLAVVNFSCVAAGDGEEVIEHCDLSVNPNCSRAVVHDFESAHVACTCYAAEAHESSVPLGVVLTASCSCD